MDNVDNLSTASNMAPNRPPSITHRELETAIELAKLRSEIVAMKEARDLQAAEYERRLELLNHENARIKDAQDQFLSKDVYEARHEDLVHSRDTMAITLTEIKAAIDAQRTAREEDKRQAQMARESMARQFTIVLGIVGLAITALTFVLNYIIQ